VVFFKQRGEGVKKVLIADTTASLVQAVAANLKGKVEIHKCQDGTKLLLLVQKLQPDILLLDLHLPGINGIDALHTLRSSGCNLPVVATGYIRNDYVCARLSQLQVTMFYCKPCSAGAVAATVLELAEGERVLPQNPENIVRHILLNLGFRMGLGRFFCIEQAIMLKLQGEDGSITKCVYPKVAKLCGGNTPQVEKAIRDGIKETFRQGNPAVWQMYFPPGKAGETVCPSNDVFLTRIAFAVQEQLQMQSAQGVQMKIG